MDEQFINLYFWYKVGLTAVGSICFFLVLLFVALATAIQTECMFEETKNPRHHKLGRWAGLTAIGATICLFASICTAIFTPSENDLKLYIVLHPDKFKLSPEREIKALDYITSNKKQ